MEQNTRTQYSFGVMKLMGEEQQVLRVKSKDPITLTPGRYHTVTEEFPDMTVTHNFKVDYIVADDSDADGYVYKWFALKEHHTATDRSPKAIQLSEQNAANLDYVCMMAGIDLPTEDEPQQKEDSTDE